MILDRLVLKNFKRFRDAEIFFKDGITGVLGNNGTGKSSLVQAIFFALYGVQATGISADYIVSSFASPKGEVRGPARLPDRRRRVRGGPHVQKGKVRRPTMPAFYKNAKTRWQRA